MDQNIDVILSSRVGKSAKKIVCLLMMMMISMVGIMERKRLLLNLEYKTDFLASTPVSLELMQKQKALSMKRR